MSTDHVQAARRAALGLPEATPPLRVPPSLVPAAAAHAQATLRDTARAVEREKLELAARYERNREQEQLRSAEEARAVAVKASGWRPFPTHVLPPVLADFIREGARAVQCDETYFALPVLTAAAAALGDSARLKLKAKWHEPAIVWTAIVGESGTAKSPALKAALGPLHAIQRECFSDYAHARELHKQSLREYESRKQERPKKEQHLEPVPEEPKCRRILTDDATTEALAGLLADNPRGLVVCKDELDAWFKFDRYTAGKGTEAQRWLELFNGGQLLVDRKGSGTLYVPRACVSLCGGIQPGIFARAVTDEHKESGLAARLLVAMPPRTARVWTDDDFSGPAADAYERTLRALYAFKGHENADGGHEPWLYELAPEARQMWAEWYTRHGQTAIQRQLEGALNATWSKLGAYCARFALVIHLVRLASEENIQSEVYTNSLKAAIQLVEWFGEEAERLTLKQEQAASEAACSVSLPADALVRLCVWIAKQPATDTTLREAQRGLRFMRGTEQAEQVMAKALDQGLVDKMQGPRAAYFILSEKGRELAATLADVKLKLD